jgi:hypothetical protein
VLNEVAVAECREKNLRDLMHFETFNKVQRILETGADRQRGNIRYEFD